MGALMSYETVIWEQSGATGRLTLNRPDSSQITVS
jgi:hypothetical protein